MFGKRPTGSPPASMSAPATAAAQRAVSPAPAAVPPPATPAGEVGRTPFPSAGLGAPLIGAPTPGKDVGGRAENAAGPGSVRGRFAPLGVLLRGQEHDLRRLDRGDRSCAIGQTRRRFRARGNPRHRQRDHRDQEHRDVDLRAGGSARRHLQRRARLWSARAAAWRATRSPTSWSTARARFTSKSPARSRRPAFAFATTSNCSTSASASSARSAAASMNRRRSATRACRTARASTPSCRRWRSTDPRSPSANSRRTSSRSSSSSDTARSRRKAPRSSRSSAAAASTP